MILKNFKLVNETSTIENSYLIIEDGKISEVGTNYEGEAIDLNGNYLMPGFVERHSHGGYGYDIMDNTDEAVKSIIENFPKEGITSYLCTTLTQDIDLLLDVTKRCLDIKNQNLLGADIVGMHLEGPFINEVFKGAQNPDFIYPGSIEMFEKFLNINKDFIKEITYAPELTTGEFTKFVRDSGCIASVGHSAATYSDIKEHIKYGLNSVTHFHNGQSPHHHRTPGVVTAGFAFDELYTEIIVDGIHLNKDTVEAVYKIKGADRITLISDSMSAKGMPDGEYDLGGLTVVKTGGEVMTQGGSLAGSCLKFNDACKNMMKFSSCTINEIVKMSSINSAKLMGIDDKVAYIKKGYDADIVVVDEDFNVQLTICKGQVAYKL